MKSRLICLFAGAFLLGALTCEAAVAHAATLTDVRTQATTTTSLPPTTVVPAPPGAPPDVHAKWLRIDPGDGTTQLIAVLRPPKGKGPFPVVITLHGGSGLLGAGIEHGARLARAGFVVVVGCWLDNQPGDPAWCPRAPFPPIAIPNLQAVARAQPGVRRNRVGVIGYSDGIDPLFNFPWGPWVHALVADSGAAFTQAREFSVDAAAPVLLLCGTNDPNCQLMHKFEAALRANGATVESKYYPGGNHVVTITDQPGTIRDNANARLIAFLKKELRS